MVELPELSDDQRFYLKTIYDYFHVEGKWPTYLQVETTILQTYPEMQSDFDLAEMSKSLPDNFASAFHFNHQYGQEAAFIAPVLAYFPEAEEERADFIKVLRFCVERVNASREEIPQLSSEDLSSQLGMQPLAIQKMGILLLSETDISNGGGSNAAEGWWRIGLQRGKQGVRRFAGVETFEQYLEKRSPLTRTVSGYNILPLLGNSRKGRGINRPLGDNDRQSARSSKQTALQFQEFVRKILEISGFTEITEPEEDLFLDFDFQAVKSSKSLNGTETSQKWIIEAKYYDKGSVRRADLDRLLGIMQRVKADKILFVTNTNLTSFTKDFLAQINAASQQMFEIWDGKKLASLIAPFPDLQKEHASFTAQLSATAPLKPEQISLVDRLNNCPPGQQTAKQYAEICIAILSEVFPILKNRRVEEMPLGGFASHSALFSTIYAKDEWIKLQHEFGAKFLFCVFANDIQLVDKNAIMQIRDYLSDDLSHIAIIFSRKGVSKEAEEMRKQIYKETKKVIIIFEDQHLRELLDRKESAQEDPLDIIISAVELLQFDSSKGVPMRNEPAEKRDITASTKTKNSAKNTASDTAKNIQPRSPWSSGSFYLFAFIAIVVILIICAVLLPWYAITLVFIAGILVLSIIGALQLRHDDRLNESNFLKLMALSFKYVPLLGKKDAKPDDAIK
jgi:hypothetical protein